MTEINCRRQDSFTLFDCIGTGVVVDSWRAKHGPKKKSDGTCATPQTWPNGAGLMFRLTAYSPSGASRSEGAAARAAGSPGASISAWFWRRILCTNLYSAQCLMYGEIALCRCGIMSWGRAQAGLVAFELCPEHGECPQQHRPGKPEVAGELASWQAGSTVVDIAGSLSSVYEVIP